MVQVEVFYFEGCPSFPPTLANIRRIARELDQQIRLIETEIHDEEQAQSVHFLGSPTVQVNGVDIEPSAKSRNVCAMSCRLYSSGPERTGIPPEELIRTALLAGA